MRFQVRSTLLSVATLGFFGVAAGAAAQEVTPTEEKTARIAPGPEYAAGGLHRLFFGAGYRELWTTPFTVPELDLSTFAGGLTPDRQRGRLQTLALSFKAGDGREYKFRSLHKEPERILPEEWRRSTPGKIVRDHTSSTHPGAALILPRLAEAIGIMHTEPRLVRMPDSPDLGAFRETFAGHVGTIEELPKKGFMGSTKVVKTVELWDLWREGPQNRVDSKEFLRARVLDLMVENYDRHGGQWLWLRLPGQKTWAPLALDPDMAFVKNEGLIFSSMRARAPRFVRFGRGFHARLEGPTQSGAVLDRWLLTDLDRQAFEAVVRETQARFTDEAIEAAGRSLPKEWQALSAAALSAALRSRRERLVDYVMHYYRDLAVDVDVHATHQDETVSIQRLEGDAVEVTVGLVDSLEPYYRRRFLKDETKEIRIYLHGGKDRVERTGPPGGPILVRVIAEQDIATHVIVDDSRSGGTDIWPGTSGTVEVKPGPGTRRHPAWTNSNPNPEAPWVEPRNYGRWTVFLTNLTYATELNFIAGPSVSRTSWGFRSEPQAQQHDLSAVWSTGLKAARVNYSGTFRRPAARSFFRVDALASGLERTNFFGYGNLTQKTAAQSEHRTGETLFSVSPSWRIERGSNLEMRLGSTLRAATTDTDATNVLNRIGAYGRGNFEAALVDGGLHFDSRGRGSALAGGGLQTPTANPEANPKTSLVAVRVDVAVSVAPALLDVTKAFGAFEGEVAGYVGRATSPAQLAARVGGRRAFGPYPWFESAVLGGRDSLRGYSRNRFAGDGALYTGLDLRVWLGTLNGLPLPLRVGVTVFSDVGRVWLEGENSRKWHPSWGAGLLIQPSATPLIFSAAYARSTEQTRRFYVGSGFLF
ncbi:MAG: hypothetical protein JJE39_03955 [Vicinamibacteria bacterium]|nr:hypothetical protein [Vicinamibacteria bacterium]